MKCRKKRETVFSITMNWRFAKLLNNNNFKKSSQISACIISTALFPISRNAEQLLMKKKTTFLLLLNAFFANFANVTNVITDKLHSGKHKQDTPC